ncbi:MAG: hypothetical protein HOP12_14140 [Candidatus Eisenbacteria bacterium]|uniref:DUF3108 domain-containing protein n=1 Tax=Eiseniibacteriota bacterium TaxID=2212470 RepID=A0A849SV94_UNCEI|nr:hypothetical protein [Candidatus Eisenbacteria bacterium]
MPRAVRLLPLFVLALALTSVRGSASDSDPAVEGSAMVDYSKPATFKVGSWVRYLTVVKGESGAYQEYYTTLIIGGEEELWGEPGFWIETLTEDVGDFPKTLASMVSYQAFGDSLAVKRPGWFLRKHIREFDAQGEPVEMIQRRDANEMKIRAANRRRLEDNPNRPSAEFDTLGVDTVNVPYGSYRGVRVRETNRLVDESAKADSTIEVHRLEVRTRSMSDDVPITHLVREAITDVIEIKSWRTGFSSGARTRLVERASGVTRVVGYGVGDYPATVVPKRVRMKSLLPNGR